MRKLTVLPLASATFFMVSGGPYGIEELVQHCGYKLALAVILLVPIVWSLPTGMMVAELSAAIPAEGGFYVWVRRGLGPFWGFQEAWLSLVSSVFDMAAYPTLFVVYLRRVWPAASSGHKGPIIASLVIAACVLWNLFGAKAVGDGSIWLAALLLTPFIVVVGAALFRHSPAGTVAQGSDHDWIAGVIVAMWNYMGWDNASTIAGEVHNPQRTYPRVMLIALAAIVASYAIPILAVWTTHVPPSSWTAGSWADIGSAVAGPWLGFVLVIAAMVSTFGILNSLTLSYSRLPLALAGTGQAPAAFTRTLSNGAPWVSLVFCGLAWTAALGLSLDRLLMLDILLYGASLILEFIALVALRVREPDLPRPFKIPGGLLAAALVGAGPAALLVLAAIRNHDEKLSGTSALSIGLILMAAGVAVYFVLNRRPAQSSGSAGSFR